MLNKSDINVLFLLASIGKTVIFSGTKKNQSFCTLTYVFNAKVNKCAFQFYKNKKKNIYIMMNLFLLLPFYGRIFIISAAFVCKHIFYGAKLSRSELCVIYSILNLVTIVSGLYWFSKFSFVATLYVLPILIIKIHIVFTDVFFSDYGKIKRFIFKTIKNSIKFRLYLILISLLLCSMINEKLAVEIVSYIGPFFILCSIFKSNNIIKHIIFNLTPVLFVIVIFWSLMYFIIYNFNEIYCINTNTDLTKILSIFLISHMAEYSDFQDFDFSDYINSLGLHNRSIGDSANGGPGGWNNDPKCQPYPFNFDDSDEYESFLNSIYGMNISNKIALRDYNNNIHDGFTVHTIEYIQKCIESNNNRLLPHTDKHLKEKSIMADQISDIKNTCNIKLNMHLTPKSLSLDEIKKEIYTSKLEYNTLLKAKSYIPAIEKGEEPSTESKVAFELWKKRQIAYFISNHVYRFKAPDFFDADCFIWSNISDMTNDKNVHEEICVDFIWNQIDLVLYSKFLLNYSWYINYIDKMTSSTYKHVYADSIIKHVKHVTIKSLIEDVKYKNVLIELSKQKINEMFNHSSEDLFLLIYKLQYEPYDKPATANATHIKGLIEINRFKQDNSNYLVTPYLLKFPPNIEWMKSLSKHTNKPDNSKILNIYKSTANINWIETTYKPK